MKAKTVLCPIDFSSTSVNVMEYATAIAKTHQAKLLIFHVAEPPQIYSDGVGVYGNDVEYQERQRQELWRYAPSDSSVLFEHFQEVGDPGSEIVRFAKDKEVDLIVIGTHGRRGISHFLLGSVAEEVVRRAPCPVLSFHCEAEQADTLLTDSDQVEA